MAKFLVTEDVVVGTFVDSLKIFKNPIMVTALKGCKLVKETPLFGHKLVAVSDISWLKGVGGS